MRIGIMGTRGIPNNYGGFEQCAEALSVRLASKGHEVAVYCSASHHYKKQTFRGVKLIHCHDPEPAIGTVGQFVYDLNCLRDARRRDFHVLLHLGYTSDAIWHRFWPRTCPNIVNLDGLEWKRSKYSRPVQRFLKWSEAVVVRRADELIADSPVIAEMVMEQYGRNSFFISYGADLFTMPDFSKVRLSLKPFQYDLLIARMEPENNIGTIIAAYLKSTEKAKKLVIIGNYDNAYGSQLYKRYGSNSSLLFTGPLYEKEMINNLRHHARFYYHGHSVGGTNPSLLEAMAASALIIAHDNPFNRSVLGEDACFFSDQDELEEIINRRDLAVFRETFIANNKEKIRRDHSWDKITDAYENLFVETGGRTGKRSGEQAPAL